MGMGSQSQAVVKQLVHKPSIVIAREPYLLSLAFPEVQRQHPVTKPEYQAFRFSDQGSVPVPSSQPQAYF